MGRPRRLGGENLQQVYGRAPRLRYQRISCLARVVERMSARIRGVLGEQAPKLTATESRNRGVEGA